MNVVSSPELPNAHNIVGYIDAVNESGIYGWAYDADKPNHVAMLTLWIDGVWIKHVSCGALRTDVGEGGHPTTEVGFRARIPKVFFDGHTHQFSLRGKNERVVLMGDGHGPPVGVRSFQFTAFFDDEFYATYHLAAEPNGGLHEYQHWQQTGSALGYFPNPETMLADLKADGEVLPDDFSPESYRLLNNDLADSVRFDWQATLHYLKFGRQEERKYKVDATRFILDLYFNGESATLEEIAKVIQRPDTYRDTDDMLARNGVTSNAFLRLFKIEDYVSCNLQLVFQNKLQCIRHFVETGRKSMAPIAFDNEFDPAYYKEATGLPAECAQSDAYLHWLNIGADRDVASCEKAALRKIGLTQTHFYPRGFDSEIYLAWNPDLVVSVTTTRWDLLESAIGIGIPEGRPGCSLDDSTCEMFRVAADRLVISRSLSSAKRIYETLLAAFPTDKMALRHYADCLLQLGEHYPASQIYRTSIDLGSDTVWSYINLCACYTQLRRWQDAAFVLCQIADLRSDDVGLQRRYDDVIREAFDNLSSDAMILAQEGLYLAARSGMDEACSLLTRRLNHWPATALLPCRIRRVALIADLGLPQCRLYRVTQKCEHLRAAGIDAAVFSFHTDIPRYLAEYGDYDAVILYRVTLSPLVVKAVEAARQAGQPVFYEIDDLMFDETVFPDSFESYGGQISHDLYAHLVMAPITTRHVLCLCDFAIASTPALAAVMAPLTRRGKSFVHRNGLGNAHRLAMMPAEQLSGPEICLFYGTGTKAHNTDFERELVPCLLRLFAKHDKSMRLVICGFLTLPQALNAYASQITHLQPIWDVQLYWNLLRTMSINIAVLSPGKVADCKSEIKWLEAAMLGIPSVVTATETHRQVIRDGETGILVHRANEWFAALDSLISSAAKRRAIGNLAKQDALKHYDASVLSANIGDILFDASGQIGAPAEAARLRILIVNVFFPPQSFGGATRVVADNIRDLMQEAGDQLEIEVFTSVEGGNQPYRLTCYRWEGIRVTGINTLDDPETDHRVVDEDVGRAFEAVVLRFRPDVIHFHCIQRLTTSLCSVAAACGVPYVITVHDAWWLSEKQFVVDEFGNAAFYRAQDPFMELQLNGAASYQRMIAKRNALQGAAGVYSVSAAFADIYKANGIDRVFTIENGLPLLSTQARSKSQDGRVRLGHLGGTSFHKGYHLVRAALSSGNFPNLHHLQIDHSLEAGTERIDRWGTTDIVIKSTVPQLHVSGLYADIDVLLAPSIWPESYGLVVREALLAGCWVIASNRGAIGQDVPPEAGFVIDVGSKEPIRELLQLINDDPKRFTRSPDMKINLRPARQQAIELLKEYRAVTGRNPPSHLKRPIAIKEDASTTAVKRTIPRRSNKMSPAGC